MNVAIVVAAGKGIRLGGNQPKQFLELGGLPIIIHTLRQFERSKLIDETIVVLPAEKSADFITFAKEFGIVKLSQAIAGGPTRARSVLGGLSAIKAAEIVAVHDGVRPFVTPDEIDRVVSAAKEAGAAVLATPVADTIKAVQGTLIVRTLARAELRRALTPQCFRFELLKRAYDQLAAAEAEAIDVSDDSVLVERLGVEIVSVEGSARNIKITNEEDLAIAEALLKSLDL